MIHAKACTVARLSMQAKSASDLNQVECRVRASLSFSKLSELASFIFDLCSLNLDTISSPFFATEQGQFSGFV